MRKFLFTGFLVFVVCSLKAVVVPEKTLLTIDGQPVGLSEFMDYCSLVCSEGDERKEKLDGFIRLKLKSIEGKSEGYDSLAIFKAMLNVVENYNPIYDPKLPESVDEKCRQRLAEENQRYERRGWAKYEMLTFPLLQSTKDEDVDRCIKEVEKLLSEIKHSGNNLSVAGKKGIYDRTDEFCPVDSHVEEVASVIVSASIGEISAPFISPVGIHLLRVIDRKKNIGMEDLNWITAYKEKIELQLMRSGKSSRRLLYDIVMASLWDNTHLYNLPTDDDMAIKEFFEKNKDNYRWDLPRYKGAIVYCQSKKDAKRIKRSLKRKDESEWEAEIGRMVDTDRIGNAYMENGLYTIGSKDVIDCLAFKCCEMAVNIAFPYIFIKGKILDKGPECYTDVEKAVNTDFESYYRNTLLQQLEQEYKVWIDEQVVRSL